MTDASQDPAPPEEEAHVAGRPDVASPTTEDDAVGDGVGEGVTLEPQAQEPARAAGREHEDSRPPPMLLGTPSERLCSVELPDFEGPLDLLLHLVRRHELDILDIPIAFVCEKYLEYLAFMQAMDLEVAGDYLVMAATLAYLKSRELVPSAPTEEEVFEDTEDGPDPREELIARLLEYQKYRAAASELDNRHIHGRDVFDRGAQIELPPVDPGLAPITMFRLAEAYQRVLERARIHKSHEVVLETMSVSERMNQLAFMLDETPRFEFDSLFLGRAWSSEGELRSMLVVTLMSILELTKLGILWVRQQPDSDMILLERRADPAQVKEILAASSSHSTSADPESADPESTDPGSDDHA